MNKEEKKMYKNKRRMNTLHKNSVKNITPTRPCQINNIIIEKKNAEHRETRRTTKRHNETDCLIST